MEPIIETIRSRGWFEFSYDEAPDYPERIAAFLKETTQERERRS